MAMDDDGDDDGDDDADGDDGWIKMMMDAWERMIMMDDGEGDMTMTTMMMTTTMMMWGGWEKG